MKRKKSPLRNRSWSKGKSCKRHGCPSLRSRGRKVKSNAPPPISVAYISSKFATLGIAMALRNELADTQVGAVTGTVTSHNPREDDVMVVSLRQCLQIWQPFDLNPNSCCIKL